MPLLPLVPADLDLTQPIDPPIPNNQDIPKNELDIFFRTIQAFIPEGKTWDDLTEKEQNELKGKYRFDYFRPSMYQGVTSCGKMSNTL